jgi:predicted O-methyltransferase YrrM
MAFQLTPEIEKYVLSHSVGYGPAGASLVEETAALGDPAVMMLAKEQYALLRFFAGMLGCRSALDVGTFTGLSALAFAEGMGSEGRVTTIDRDRPWIEIARRHWRTAGVLDRIEAINGEAIDVLSRLVNSNTRFDIAFLDVDKARIGDYFDAVLKLLEPRGLIAVDNTLWHGWVLDEWRGDADTVGMRAFNDRIAGDDRLEAVMLPIGDGLTLVRMR